MESNYPPHNLAEVYCITTVDILMLPAPYIAAMFTMLLRHQEHLVRHHLSATALFR